MRKVIAIDLGNSMGVATQGYSSHININTDNVIRKLEAAVWSLKNCLIVTALPNVYSKMFYNIIINQAKLLGILEHHVGKKNILLIKESAANKVVVWKGRCSKDETLNAISSRRPTNVSSFDEADAIKFYLYYGDTYVWHQANEWGDTEPTDS